MPELSADAQTLLPDAFARVVADGIERIVAHQQADGSIVFNPEMGLIYPQQAIMPMAFCYAGLDPNKRHHRSPALREAILRLGEYLVGKFDHRGHFFYDAKGYKVDVVDQRLTYAWIEGLRILREAGGDFPFYRWADKLTRACNTLISDRLHKLVGLRRFIVKFQGTGTNHVVLYLTTVFRGGQVLKDQRMIDVALPLARAMAADVHPDGYWEEHSDMLRAGGPTPAYNYLSHNGIALMYEWTGEKVFLDAIDRSIRFHDNFCYPDSRVLDLIDERVRTGFGQYPPVWGLHGFSFTPRGRGVALRHFERARQAIDDPDASPPEALARLCENYLYWHKGPVEAPSFERPDHQAELTLPASITRRGSWCVALSAMRALTPEDPGYRENPFSLDRQKLMSVWHEKTGLILDGSHSKNQPQNSTFWARTSSFSSQTTPTVDYYPIGGGSVSREGDDLISRAVYKSFLAEARLRVISNATLRIELSVDPAGNSGPFEAGFTIWRLAQTITTLSGASHALGDEPFTLSPADLGGGFQIGPVRITSPQAMRLEWPMSPYNSYYADHIAPKGMWLPRVAVELTQANPRASFEIRVME